MVYGDLLRGQCGRVVVLNAILAILLTAVSESSGFWSRRVEDIVDSSLVRIDGSIRTRFSALSAIVRMLLLLLHCCFRCTDFSLPIAATPPIRLFRP